MSFISGQVPLRLKGITYVMSMTGGHARIGRLKNVKVDHLAAMRAIAEEHRRVHGPEEDEADPSLQECLAGFGRYFDEYFGVLLPLDVAEGVPAAVYHDSGMCGLTRRCHVADCPNREGADEASTAAEISAGLAAQKL